MRGMQRAECTRDANIGEVVLVASTSVTTLNGCDLVIGCYSEATKEWVGLPQGTVLKIQTVIGDEGPSVKPGLRVIADNRPGYTREYDCLMQGCLAWILSDNSKIHAWGLEHCTLKVISRP